MSNNTKDFLTRLKGKIFKIMPMKENNDITLPTYIDGLRVKIIGMTYIDKFLNSNYEYASVISIISFMTFNDFSCTLCKREVLKALDLIDVILSSIKDGESNE